MMALVLDFIAPSQSGVPRTCRSVEIDVLYGASVYQCGMLRIVSPHALLDARHSRIIPHHIEFWNVVFEASPVFIMANIQELALKTLRRPPFLRNIPVGQQYLPLQRLTSSATAILMHAQLQ
jgi:hypothetical protein